MRTPNPTRYLVPVTLLALLLVGMTIGAACHHHDASCDSNCTICHLGHQPMDQPMAASHGPTLVLLAPTAEPRAVSLAPNPVFRRVPARAPPIA
jgi:hypothetical protein